MTADVVTLRPAAFKPCTAASIATEKAEARRRLEEQLQQLRPFLWTVLREDPARDPIAYAAAWKEIQRAHLDNLVLEAAYGNRQAQYWTELGYADSGLSSLQETAVCRRASLPANWWPNVDDEKAAARVNVVDAGVAAAIARIPLGSRWRTKSGLTVTATGYSNNGHSVTCRFDHDGKTGGFGLKNFMGPDPWLRRVDAPAAPPRRRRARRGTLRVVRSSQ
jgi:hypothetical protein